MEMLKFAGGVDIGELTSHSAGYVRERHAVPLREAASKRSLIIEEHDVNIVKKDVIDGFVNKIMGSTSVPKLNKLSTPRLIHEIKRLQSDARAGAVADTLPNSAYVPMHDKDVEAQKANAIERAREKNEAARTKALLTAIREEGAATQGAIAKHLHSVHSDTNAIQVTVAAIFNRKVGAEDRYQKAMLTSQYMQESIARDQLEVSKLSSRMVHEIGLKLVHNTSLPDIIKSTHEERTAILDEENVWKLKNALMQGNLESTLRNLNNALVNRAMAGVGKVATKINSMGVDDAGEARTRTGAIKDWAVNSWDKYRDGVEVRRNKFNKTREEEGWWAAQKERAGDISASLWERTKGAGSSVGESVGSRWKGGREYWKDNSFSDMLGHAKDKAKSIKDEAKFQLLDKEGLVRRWGINPIKDAGAATWEAVSSTMSGKSDYELAVDRTTGITVTIPDHLAKIHASIEKIYNSIDCVCDKKPKSGTEAVQETKAANTVSANSADLAANSTPPIPSSPFSTTPAPAPTSVTQDTAEVNRNASVSMSNAGYGTVTPARGDVPQPKPETQTASAEAAEILPETKKSLLDAIEDAKEKATRERAKANAPLVEDPQRAVMGNTTQPTAAQGESALTKLMEERSAARDILDTRPKAQREAPIPYTPVADRQDPLPRKQYGQVDKSLYQPMAYRLSTDEAEQLKKADSRKAEDTFVTTSKDSVDMLSAKINDTPKKSAADINNDANAIVGVEKTIGHLMMFPEYRKMLARLGKRSSTKLVPKEQAVLVDRATEQVALLAMISKKLDAGSALGGTSGGAGGLLGSLGSGAMGAVGGALARGGAGLLMRLLPLALSPPGLLAMTVLAAYLGRDKIAETLDVMKKEAGELYTDGKNYLVDGAHKIFGDKSENMIKEEAELARKIKDGELSPTDVHDDVAKADKRMVQKEIFGAQSGGIAGVTIAAGKHVRNMVGNALFGEEEEDITGDSANEGDQGDGYFVPGDGSSLKSAYTGSLSTADGDAYFLPDVNPRDVLEGTSKYLDRFDKLNYYFRGNFLGMAYEYKMRTGKTIFVNETVRNRSDQEAHYRKSPQKAAKPGTSMHEFGFAVDASVAKNDALAKCEEMGLMRKYGLWRPLGKPLELWHVEPIGIHPFWRKIRTGEVDDATIARGIMGHRGYGGGGNALLNNGKSREDAAYHAQRKGGKNVATAKKADMKDANPPVDDTSTSMKQTPPTPAITTSANVTPSKINSAGALGTSNVTSTMQPSGGDSPSVESGGPTDMSKLQNVHFKSNPDLYIVKKMMELGWPEAAAVATAANAKQESSLNPTAINPSSKAEGLFQWLGHRLDEYRKRVGKRPVESTVDEQIAHLDFELRNGRSIRDPQTQKGGDKLLKSTDPMEATKIFAEEVERAGANEMHTPKRQGYAREILHKLKGKTGSETAGSTANKSYYMYGDSIEPSGDVPVPKKDTTIVNPVNAPVNDPGFTKVSYKPASRPTPPPEMFNTTEINAILMKSHTVQTDMLSELRKLNAVFSNQQGKDSKPPLQKPQPAVDTSTPSLKNRVRENTISSTDQVGAII